MSLLAAQDTLIVVAQVVATEVVGLAADSEAAGWAVAKVAESGEVWAVAESREDRACQGHGAEAMEEEEMAVVDWEVATGAEREAEAKVEAKEADWEEATAEREGMEKAGKGWRRMEG